MVVAALTTTAPTAHETEVTTRSWVDRATAVGAVQRQSARPLLTGVLGFVRAVTSWSKLRSVFGHEYRIYTEITLGQEILIVVLH